MDYSNFKDGTIFDTIIKINEEMTDKLKMRIDLRKDGIMVGEEAENAKADSNK